MDYIIGVVVIGLIFYLFLLCCEMAKEFTLDFLAWLFGVKRKERD